MKVALIIYSLTGHTKSVADKIKSLLVSEGHSADYLQINHEPKQENGNPNEKVVFKDLPDLDAYDTFVFGSYVEAFNLCRVMQQYLQQLNNKSAKAVCLTTQQFMKSFLGGNQAQKKMKKLLTAKEFSVVGGANVGWKFEEGREQRIYEAAQKICNLLK